MNKTIKGKKSGKTYYFEFKKITLADMMSYIEDEHIEDKEWFKSVSLDADGKYNHLRAVRAFCSRYCPELVPAKKNPAPRKSDMLKDW